MKYPNHNKLKTAIALALSIGLVGCGSGEKITATPSLEGVAVDGYLSGMFCYADVNNNSTWDPDVDVGANRLTDEQGKFTLTGEGLTGANTICRAELGAIDQATSESFVGQLSAPAGAEHVSPVTTLVVALGGDQAAEISARSILGLDASVNLSDNPMKNPSLAKAAAKVQSVVAAISKTISQQTGVSDIRQQNAIVAETFKALANNAGGNLLNDQTVLSNVINEATTNTTTSTTNPETDNLIDSVEALFSDIDSEYDPIINDSANLTAEEIETRLKGAQSNSISNTQFESAFTNNGVSPTENSLTISEELEVDNSEIAVTKILFSSAGNENQDPETFAGEFPLSDFGSGAIFNADVTTDASFPRVFSVTSGNGYGAQVAFAAFVNYTAGFTQGFDAFRAKVKGTPNNQMEVKFFGDDSQESAVIVDLSTYEGATDIGNGWYEIEVPFDEFTNGTRANFQNHSGWLIGPPGDNGDTSFEFFFTDVSLGFTGNEFNTTDDGSDPDENDDVTIPVPEGPKTLYSGSSAESDDSETFNGLSDFGNGATFDANVTTDTSFDRVFSVTSGEGYGENVHVAFVAFTGHSVGFASGYAYFNVKVKGSPDGRVEIKLIDLNEEDGKSPDSVVEVNVNTYSGSTDLGNGWYQLSIPLSEFANFSSENLATYNGWLIGPPGDQADENFVFYFTDAGFGVEPLEVETPAVNYKLVWSNEFDDSDLSDWNIETGYGPNNDGWGNDESQLYTNSEENILVENGNLIITAKCDLTVTGACGKRDDSITSARLTTKDKVEFRYGKIEARIKVPDGTSTWPALWMLGAAFPDTPWPNAGEIDIMEVWQTNNASINQSNSTIHYDLNGRVFESGNTTLPEALSDDFQVWTMEWTESEIKFTVQGEEYFTVDITDSKYDAFRESFFLIMNVAVDGTLGGGPDQIANTPQQMLVDYVRLYQNPESTNNLFTETILSGDEGSLIANGDFSSSQDAWSGNAFNVVAGENVANVETAGNPWDVNLSNVVELTAGETYTLTFDARGTEGRTLIAGIGLNEGDYASATETVTLATEYQTFTITFENIGFGSVNSRVLFDMGADSGEVVVDNVSLVKGLPNLIQNGDFSDDSLAWTGNALNVVEGENVANVATAGNPWDVNLSNPLELESGATYSLTFKAKGTAGRTLIAGIGLNEGDYASATETVTLGTEYQTFTSTFENIGFGSVNSRVLFDMGADVGEVVTDDVVLEKVEIQNEASLLTNGDFSDTTAAWSGNALNVIDGANLANVETAGNPWDVNLSNILELEPGASYTLSFKARGTEGRSIIAGIGLNEGDYASATETVTLGADWQTFSYTFSDIGFGSENSRVLFDMGADVGEVVIDDVSLVKN